MLGIFSIVFLNLFSETTDWVLLRLRQGIRRLRPLVVSRWNRQPGGPRQPDLTGIASCSLLDPEEAVVSPADRV